MEVTKFKNKGELTDYINYCIKYNVTKNKDCILKGKYFKLVVSEGKATYPSSLNLKGIREEGAVICE